MRKIQHGINWVWYITDTRKDAKKWFEELTGSKPIYHWIIQKDKEGTFSFRLHR